MTTDRRPTFRRYLLQTLPETEATALEEQYFVDDDLLDELTGVEHELIDDFLDGRLAEADRTRFVASYLASPVHRARVAAAKALRSHTVTEPGRVLIGPWRGQPVIRLAVAAVLLIGLVALMRLLPQPVPRNDANAGVQSQPPAVTEAPRVPAPAATATPEPMSPGLPSPPPPTPSASSSLFAITLPAVITRAAGQASVTIPSTTTRVLLQLEGDAAGMRDLIADIRTVEGRVVWQGPATRGAAGLLATIEIPSTALPPDDYMIAVSSPGTPPIEAARYALRVRRP